MLLTDVATVKDMAFIPTGVTTYDTIIQAIIARASDEVAVITRRAFEKVAKTDYFQTYPQDPSDPTPQFIFLDGPVDRAQPLTVEYVAPPMGVLPADAALALTPTTLTENVHFTLDDTTGDLIILPGYSYWHNPRGFKVTYTGGYTTTSGVVDVPTGLKTIVAQHCADTFVEGKRAKPWTDDEQAMLKQYRKRDLLFA